MGSESVGSSFHAQPNPNQPFLFGQKNGVCGFEGAQGISPNRSPVNESHRDTCYSCKQQGHWSKDCPNKANKAQGVSPNWSPVNGSHRDTCYSCKQQGHWFKDCPNKANKTKSPGGANASTSNIEIPEKQCHCGQTCWIFTSNTEKNPQRKFYRCPEKDEKTNCNFFLWCDLAKINPKHTVLDGPESNNPTCTCGAGKPVLYTVTDGVDAGRRYFACFIKKGQGACQFFQWYDPPVISQSKEKNKQVIEDSPVVNRLYEPKTPTAKDKQHQDSTASSGRYEPNEPVSMTPSSTPLGPDMQREFLTNDILTPTACVSNGTGDLKRTLTEEFESDYGSHYDLPPVESLNISEARGSGGRHMVCFNCGEEGHWESQCASSPASM